MSANVLTKPVVAKLLDRNAFWQLVRYLITGFSSAGLEIALFAFLANVILQGVKPPEWNSVPHWFFEFIQQLVAVGFVTPEKVNVFYANVISVTVVFWFNFLANRIFSFRSRTSIVRQLGIFGPLFLFNLGATSVIIGFLVNFLDVYAVYAKVISIGCVVSWNFMIYKLIIFR